MALIAVAVPIKPDKKAQWQGFVKELQGSRNKEFNESRKKAGVRERSFHQETPMGEFVIVTLEGADPESAMMRFAQDKSPFSQWFVSQVKEIHGVDLSQPPPSIPKLLVDTGA